MLPPLLARLSYYPDRAGDSVSVCVMQKAQRRRSGSQPVAASPPTATAPPPPKITEFVASFLARPASLLLDPLLVRLLIRPSAICDSEKEPSTNEIRTVFCILSLFLSHLWQRQTHASCQSFAMGQLSLLNVDVIYRWTRGRSRDASWYGRHIFFPLLINIRSSLTPSEEIKRFALSIQVARSAGFLLLGNESNLGDKCGGSGR